MTIQTSLPEYLTFCQNQKQLDAKTIKAYRIDLTQLASRLPDTELTDIQPKTLEAIITDWHAKYKPKTVKRKIASVKAYFTWLFEQEMIAGNPFDKIHTKFREPKALPRTIPKHELEQFLKTLQDTDNIRHIAIINTLFATGIRISELCQITPQDINIQEGELLIHGKGNKERAIPIPHPELLAVLTKYEQKYHDAIQNTNRFFVNDRNQPLRDASVRNIINHYQEKAGISLHITPHMFRHSFATMLLDLDVNLRCIQEILGHSSIQTTEIYTHVGLAKKRQILMDHHPLNQLQL